MQTNGVLIDEHWAAFFAANDVLVGLSVDGPREMHDGYRVDKGGLGSFDRVMAGSRTCRAAGADVNVLCTDPRGQPGSPGEVYRFFRDEHGRPVHAVHPDRRAHHAGDAAGREQGWGETTRRSPLYVQEGDLVTDRSVHPRAATGGS